MQMATLVETQVRKCELQTSISVLYSDLYENIGLKYEACTNESCSLHCGDSIDDLVNTSADTCVE